MRIVLAFLMVVGLVAGAVEASENGEKSFTVVIWDYSKAERYAFNEFGDFMAKVFSGDVEALTEDTEVEVSPPPMNRHFALFHGRSGQVPKFIASGLLSNDGKLIFVSKDGSESKESFYSVPIKLRARLRAATPPEEPIPSRDHRSSEAK